MEPARASAHEDPYRRILRLQEEIAGWEVQAHRALLEARKLEAKAARLSVKSKGLLGKADAHVARSESIGHRAMGMVHEEDVVAKDLKVEKSRQLGFEAEALRQKAGAVESQAEQLRIAARAKIAESARHLEAAKRLAVEIEALRAAP